MIEVEEDLSESARRPGDALTIEVVELEEGLSPGLPEIAIEPAAVVEPAPEILAVQEVPNQDAAFESIVRDMAASFSTDSLDHFVPEPFEVAQTEPEIARDAVEAVMVSVAEESDMAVSPESEVAPEPSRTQRLGVAVKLTGQALNAWMGVLQQTTPLASAR